MCCFKRGKLFCRTSYSCTCSMGRHRSLVINAHSCHTLYWLLLQFMKLTVLPSSVLLKKNCYLLLTFFVVTFYYRYIYILYIQILVWIDWKNKWVITHFSQPCVGGFASVWFICYLHKSGPLVLWDWIHVSFMVYMYLYLYCVVFST